MSIPIHILFPPSTQSVISKTPKTAAKPLDANYIFQSVKELEDYIKNDITVFVGQVVVVDRDVVESSILLYCNVPEIIELIISTLYRISLRKVKPAFGTN